MKKLAAIGAGLLGALAIATVPTFKTHASPIPPVPGCTVYLPVVPPTIYYVECTPYYDPGTGVTYNAFTLRGEDLGV